MKMVIKILSAIFRSKKSSLSEQEIRAILSMKEVLGVPLSGWARSSMGDLYEGRAKNDLGPGFGGRVKKRSA